MAASVFIAYAILVAVPTTIKAKKEDGNKKYSLPKHFDEERYRNTSGSVMNDNSINDVCIE